MVSFSATIDEAGTKAIQNALSRFSESLGTFAKTAPQRAAIQMCKSFRAATKSAPKYARTSEYTSHPSETQPKHVTARDGRDLRRYAIDRTVRGVKYDKFVYAHLKRTNRGRIVSDRSSENREVRKTLLLKSRGLAKKSWGWVMHNIFNGAAPDTPWHRRKRDVRDPKKATSLSTSSANDSSTEYFGYARISNRLDYITSAFKSGFSINDAIRKTTNWLVKMADLNARKFKP